MKNRGVSKEGVVENICAYIKGGIKGILEEVASQYTLKFLLISEHYYT
jgi:hypothetical protein